MIEPRFPVTPEQIDAVVADFYAFVREHPGLGPVFARHVTDWPTHEAKIARFWRNAILFEKGYDGNPLAVHRAAGNVRPGMFDPWLGLFDMVLRRNLPPETPGPSLLTGSGAACAPVSSKARPARTAFRACAEAPQAAGATGTAASCTAGACSSSRSSMNRLNSWLRLDTPALR